MAYLETESIIGAARRFLEGGEGEGLWDLSADPAAAAVLVEKARITDVVNHVIRTGDDRRREIGVGILANLCSHRRDSSQLTTVLDVFEESSDPPTLVECLRYLAAQGYPDTIKAKLIFILHNSLDSQLLATTVAYAVGLVDDDVPFQEDLITAAVPLLEDRADDLAAVQLLAFPRFPSGLDALFHVLEISLPAASLPATTTTKLRTACAALRDGDDVSDTVQTSARSVLDLLEDRGEGIIPAGAVAA